MKATVEREIKLAVEPDFVLPALPGAPLEARFLEATYWDTASRSLARLGITLRHRVENGHGRWQLKLPRGVARVELEVSGGPGQPPVDLAELLVAITRNDPLGRAATLRTRRSGRVVHDGKGSPVAEAVVDRVSVLDDGTVTARFTELEVELIAGGSERDLRRIEKALRAAGATDGDGRPKLLRALGIGEPTGGAAAAAEAAPVDGAAEVDGATSATAAPPAAGAAATPSLLRLTQALEAQHRMLLTSDPGTRLGTDPEDLHDMRVATRRIRSFLRTARDLVDPAWSEPLRAELAWLADELGAVRDLDVLIERLEPEVAALDPDQRAALETALLARLHNERGLARELLVAGLASQRYFALLDALEAPSAFREEAAAAPGLPETAAAEYRRLRRAMRRIDASSPDEQVHATRIRGKRARYAAELAQPLLGKRAAGLIAATKALQDVLGEHQDSAVAEEHIRRLTSRDRGVAAFAGGRLAERERGRRAAARLALPAAWDAVERRARRAFS